MFLHVVLVAESRLQLNPVGAWHQREKGVAHVEVEQVAATGVRHQQQAAFVQPPEFLHGPTWGAFVLRQNPQLPARGGLNVVESLFQTGALGIGEGLGEIDHRRRVVRQQLGIVVGVSRQGSGQGDQGCQQHSPQPCDAMCSHGPAAVAGILSNESDGCGLSGLVGNASPPVRWHGSLPSVHGLGPASSRTRLLRIRPGSDRSPRGLRDVTIAGS